MSSFLKLSILLLFSALLYMPGSIYAQNCEAFRDGKFRLTNEWGKTYIIERKGNIQTELDTSNELKLEFEVEWSDECTYHLTFKKILNNPYGVKTHEDWELVTVKIIETKPDSYIQESSMVGFDYILTNELMSITNQSSESRSKDSIRK